MSYIQNRMVKVWFLFSCVAIFIHVVPTFEHYHWSHEEQAGTCDKYSFLETIVCVIGIQEWIFSYILKINYINERCSNNVHYQIINVCAHWDDWSVEGVASVIELCERVGFCKFEFRKCNKTYLYHNQEYKGREWQEWHWECNRWVFQECSRGCNSFLLKDLSHSHSGWELGWRNQFNILLFIQILD